jgi:tetratricopeptide (TPR) repeat protein
MSDQSDEIKYLDFELTIDRAAGDEYLVRATSCGGNAEVRFANPFNEDKRQIVKSLLTAAALRSVALTRQARMRSASAPEVREMKSFGALLFQEALSGAVKDFYQRCQSQADRDRCGIRLRLALDQSVDDLPWEFLCLDDDFVALNPKSPVVRYIEGTAPCSLVKVEYPLKVLVVIAKPSDEVPLDTDAEKNSITDALRPLAEQGLVELDFIEGNDTWEKLMDALLPNRTHILHFIGHGAFDDKNGEGVLIMADADGKTMVLDSERLRVLVQGKSRLALIVLNSCLGTQGGDAQPFSSVAAGLVKSGIPAVIAMQFEISDVAAQAIAETFYTSLALNMPVDAALTEARRRIFLSDRNSLEWATPILYMQVPDGQLFEFKGPRPETKPPARIDEDTFTLGAAQRYQEGKAAIARGDWIGAVTAFRGAMVYVPNYRDAAEQLSFCASRANVAGLKSRVETLVAAKDYDGALELLNQLEKLDSDEDVTVLRRTIECGQKYKRAVSELQRNNQQEAAELLREVIRQQPGFEDAAERLNDLASGGDGLFGSRPGDRDRLATRAPKKDTQFSIGMPELQAGWTRLNQWWNSKPAPGSAPASTEPTQAEAVTKGFSWRRYEVANPNLRQLAEEMRQYFSSNGCEHQIFQQEKGWVVQGRKVGKWRDFVGMAQAATILIESDAGGMKVSIGGAKWIDKAAGAAVGVFLGFTWVTAIYGVIQQDFFVGGLWQIAENFTKTRGGRQVAFG